MRAIEFPRASGVRIIPRGTSFVVVLPIRLSREVWVNKGQPGERRVPERKQFASLQEAKNFAAERVAGTAAVGGSFLALDRAAQEAGVRLTEAVRQRGGEFAAGVDDVLAALKALGTSPVRLADCVSHALPRLAPAKMVTVDEAVVGFLASLDGQVSEHYARTMGIYLARLTSAFGPRPLAQLDAVVINNFIEDLRTKERNRADGKREAARPASPKYRRHVLMAVRRLVKYSVQRGWLSKHIVDWDVVQTPRKPKGGVIEVWSTEEVAALLAAAQETDPELVPFLALGAFAGLRSAEAARLEWGEVDFAQGHIEVAAHKAKTASRRLVPLLPNLAAWLEPLKAAGGRVCDYDVNGSRFTGRLQALAKASGVGRWRKNALRHSFISYRTAAVQNVNQVALEAGNTPQVIFSSYRALVTQKSAENWFRIKPESRPDNVTRLAGVV